MYVVLFILGKCLLDSYQLFLIFTEVWLYNFCVSWQDFQMGCFFFHCWHLVSVKNKLLWCLWTSVNYLLVCLVCQETMALKNFFFRENWVGSKVAGMKISFSVIFDPIWTNILAPKKVQIWNSLNRILTFNPLERNYIITKYVT